MACASPVIDLATLKYQGFEAELPVDSSKREALIGTASKFFTLRFAQLQAQLNAQAARILSRTCSLSLVQWRIVAMLAITQPSTSTDICMATSMDKGLFSRNLKRLVAEGIVSIDEDHEDNRRHILSLTPAGQNLHDATFKIMAKRQEALMAEVTEEERTLLFSILDRIGEAARRDDV